MKIKSVREKKGITQRELAELLQISISYLSKIETGRKATNTVLAVRIANALECTLSDLISAK